MLTTKADRFSQEELDVLLAASSKDDAGNLDYKALVYTITHGQTDEDAAEE